MMGWPVNHQPGTYDRTKVNIVPAPNDDYTEAGKMYIDNKKVTLRVIENGKVTDKDTTLVVSGVSSWFPVDEQLISQKGGLLTLASTKDFASQMACAIIFIHKWAVDNRTLVEKFIEGIAKGGDQIKSHDEALQFACKVNESVFADAEKDASEWYKAFKSYDLTDDDGNVVNIGGSRAFNIADVASYTGVVGGKDRYKEIYNTFGSLCIETYPEVMSTYDEYENVTDWSFLKAVYNRMKAEGVAGSSSKVDFTTSKKGDIVGDANYNIQFDINSDRIRPESYAILNKIVGQLSVAENLFIEISGHTDVSGDATANQILSEKRAQSVLSYLAERGGSDIKSPGRSSAKGYGESKTLEGVSSSDAKNRRVEIKLYKAN